MEISNRIFQTYISITYLKSEIETDINGKPPDDVDFRLVQPMHVHCGGKADCKGQIKTKSLSTGSFIWKK